VKSACFFCPASKQHEILQLEPTLQDAAVAMERNYREGRHYREDGSTKGLGRRFSWEELLRQRELSFGGDE